MNQFLQKTNTTMSKLISFSIVEYSLYTHTYIHSGDVIGICSFEIYMHKIHEFESSMTDHRAHIKYSFISFTHPIINLFLSIHIYVFTYICMYFIKEHTHTQAKKKKKCCHDVPYLFQNQLILLYYARA